MGGQKLQCMALITLVVGMLDNKIRIRFAEPLLKLGPRMPTEFMHPVDIKKLPRGAVRLAGIPYNTAFKSDNILYKFGKFADGNIFIATDID